MQTCTIITTQPNDVVAPIHDRMPVIVPKVARDLWLNPKLQDPSKLLNILQPYPAEEMICGRVDG